MGNAPSWQVANSQNGPAGQEPIIDLTNPKSRDFPKETGTGEWFAVGDANLHTVPPSIMPPPSIPAPRASRARRIIVRMVGFLAIAGTLAGLVRVATYPPARQAILRWGSFGRVTHAEVPVNSAAGHVR
jgi:hypothetical protein